MNYVGVSGDDLRRVSNSVGIYLWERRTSKEISSRKIIAEYLGGYFTKRFGYKESSIESFIGMIESGKWVKRLKNICLNEEHPESDPSVVLFYAYLDSLGIDEGQRENLCNKLREVCFGFPYHADEDYQLNRFEEISD